jgi:flagellar assembly factor FliW
MTLTAEGPTQEAHPLSEEPVADDFPVLELVEPLVGFPDLQRFGLARLDESGTVFDLRSLEDPHASFVVVPPGLFFSGYTPEVDDVVVEQLGLQKAEDVLAFVMVTLGESLDDATANLRAPLLVNQHSRRAVQTILDDPELPMKAPLAGF